MQLTTCVIIISSIWVFSVFVTLPYGLYMNHKYVDGRFYCEETWPSENFRQVSKVDRRARRRERSGERSGCCAAAVQLSLLYV